MARSWLQGARTVRWAPNPHVRCTCLRLGFRKQCIHLVLFGFYRSACGIQRQAHRWGRLWRDTPSGSLGSPGNHCICENTLHTFFIPVECCRFYLLNSRSDTVCIRLFTCLITNLNSHIMQNWHSIVLFWFFICAEWYSSWAKWIEWNIRIKIKDPHFCEDQGSKIKTCMLAFFIITTKQMMNELGTRETS